MLPDDFGCGTRRSARRGARRRRADDWEDIIKPRGRSVKLIPLGSSGFEEEPANRHHHQMPTLAFCEPAPACEGADQGTGMEMFAEVSKKRQLDETNQVGNNCQTPAPRRSQMQSLRMRGGQTPQTSGDSWQRRSRRSHPRVAPPTRYCKTGARKERTASLETKAKEPAKAAQQETTTHAGTYESLPCENTALAAQRNAVAVHTEEHSLRDATGEGRQPPLAELRATLYREELQVISPSKYIDRVTATPMSMPKGSFTIPTDLLSSCSSGFKALVHLHWNTTMAAIRQPAPKWLSGRLSVAFPLDNGLPIFMLYALREASNLGSYGSVDSVGRTRRGHMANGDREPLSAAPRNRTRVTSACDCGVRHCASVQEAMERVKKRLLHMSRLRY